VEKEWEAWEALEYLPPLWMKILGRMDFLRGNGFALL
jgi:hypothetical protein